MKHEIAIASEAIDSDLLILYGGAFKSYRKDEYIFQEGDHPQYYHQIISGRVKRMSETDDGKEFIQGFSTDGQSFGEPLIFDGDENPAFAIAEHPSVIIRLCIFSFKQLLKENFDVHFNLTKRLSHRLKNGSNALTKVSCNTPENRIVSILNHLRVETVIRVMRNLNSRQILDIKKGKVFY
jgi:CRP-like cAMP-binding protein